ncbi:hypothetical protein HC248_00839 [Polaromonas vacuolata]|uniref:Uncharacterized protein n=1 Tax=Polaromonas vacuolata TaxID=37448 RepID=A0A6H2H6S3_9BURK|nr:hypothetical protein [Polaromonas vacuolata]QJC55558.1 hypothetical protein HC248_00839 [Polaromonas vacuolata]
MMEWIPIVFITFKVLVLSIGMFFAVRWHYNQGGRKMDKLAVLRATGKVAALFVLALLTLGLLSYFVVRKLGLEMY